MSARSKLLMRSSGIFILLWLLASIDREKLSSQFTDVRMEYFIPAIAILFVFHILKSVRWQYLLKVQGINISLLDAYVVYVSGLFLGLATPGRVGDFVKIIYLKQVGVPGMKAFFLSLLDRLLDLFFLVGCAAAGFLSATSFGGPQTFFPVAAMLFVMMFVLCLKAGAILRIGSAPISKVSARFSRVLEKWLGEVQHFGACYRAEAIFLLTAQTMLGWALYALCIYSLGQGIRLEIGFTDVMAFVAFSSLAAFIPLSIAGIGTRDLVLVTLFPLFGYTAEQAMAFSVLILINYGLTALFGFAVWTARPLKIVDATKSAAL